MKQTEQHVILALAVSAMRNLAASDLARNATQRNIISATVGMLERLGDYHGVDDTNNPVKLVLYYGKPYIVPGCANWLTVDSDGNLFWFTSRPEWESDIKIWMPQTTDKPAANYGHIGSRHDVDAETSLVEVPA